MRRRRPRFQRRRNAPVTASLADSPPEMSRAPEEFRIPRPGGVKQCQQLNFLPGRNQLPGCLKGHYTPEAIPTQHIGSCWRHSLDELARPHCQFLNRLHLPVRPNGVIQCKEWLVVAQMVGQLPKTKRIETGGGNAKERNARAV